MNKGNMNLKAVDANRRLLSEIRKSASDELRQAAMRTEAPNIDFYKGASA